MKPHRREHFSDQTCLFVNRRCLILLAGLLAGCARFEPQPLPPADTATRLEARRLDDDALKRFLHAHLGRDLESWPPPSWDLDMLTLAAFFFNPSLDVARAQLAVARAGEISAGGGRWSALTFLYWVV